MIKPSKIIGTGLATAGLIGAGMTITNTVNSNTLKFRDLCKNFYRTSAKAHMTVSPVLH